MGDIAGLCVGLKGSADLVVGEQHTAPKVGSGRVHVLATPVMINLIEAAALDVQLVLSGHTHGGQVIVPGLGPLARRRFPVLAGYATRDNTSIFVSRGVGTVYVPVRINCPPDIAILTLRTVAA